MNLEQLKKKICTTCSFNGELNVTATQSDRLTVDGNGFDVKIGYADITDFCRGVSLAIGHIRKGEKEFHIEQKRRIKTTGIMFEMCGDSTMRVESAKEYIDYMAAMGLNMLMLYTEDTYYVERYPEMGYLRGRYTPEEFREIDAYASQMGVELIGCVELFGHMSQFLKWKKYDEIAENADILLPGEPKTYEFIEECIKTISENISSRRIHIGLDETFGLCEGKYKAIHGVSDPLEVYTEHIIKVYDICKKYGLKPMMWSDNFFRYSMKNPNYGIQYSATEPINPKILEKVPKDMEMVYWEYEEQSQEVYDSIIKAHNPLGGKCIMATAAHTWDGQLPYLDYIFNTNVPALEASVDNNLETAFVTAWTNEPYSASDIFWTLPALALYAQYSYDGADTGYDGVKELLKNCTDMDLDILKPMNVYHSEKRFHFYYGEKYLYCPTLINTIGSFTNPAEEFKKSADEVRSFKSERWNELYEFCADILDAVALKSELLNNLQKAYFKKDTKYLETVSSEKLTWLIEMLESLRKRKQDRWLKVKKPFGFQRTNYLYGGAIADAMYAKSRLDSYLNGEISKIEELEEEIHGYEYASLDPDYRFV